MNEQIKGLATKVVGLKLLMSQYVGYEKDLEKFAELIIKECLAQNKIAIQSLKDDPEDIPGYKTILNLSRATCRNQIEEHFGVEE